MKTLVRNINLNYIACKRFKNDDSFALSKDVFIQCYDSNKELFKSGELNESDKVVIVNSFINDLFKINGVINGDRVVYKMNEVHLIGNEEFEWVTSFIRPISEEEQKEMEK
jgi:hypothetical protein